ncbi:MAG: hypothetical protein HY700_16905 [Gemmatimonadetes bacterium]|nr:hypothetical protein [Gemmatimonadota bacterium]
MDNDEWPLPPYWLGDYPLLRELLGTEEFERLILGSESAALAHSVPTDHRGGGRAEKRDCG